MSHNVLCFAVRDTNLEFGAERRRSSIIHVDPSKRSLQLSPHSARFDMFPIKKEY